MRLSIISRLVLATAVLLAFSAGLSAGGKRVVFIGDSITDGNWGNVYNYKKTSVERSQTDMNHIYGHSYVMLIASDWQSAHPGSGYSFFNRGFSGHKLCDLAARWQEDVLDLDPDILSVLVGTNDIHAWLDGGGGEDFDFAAWKASYGSLLQKVIDRNPAVELVLCTPFVARQGALAKSPTYDLRERLTIRMADVVRELCDEYDAVCVPFDTLFAKLISKQPTPSYWIWDGIHPTPAGHRRMADLWKRKSGFSLIAA